MKTTTNWGEVKDASEFERLVPGGYVCQITMVKDVPEKEYLLITCDVSEGEYKDCGQKYEEETGNEYGYIQFIRSYKKKAEGFFKQFLKSIEGSNNGKFIADKFDNNEMRLIGLSIGIVLQAAEYQAKDGQIKNKTIVAKTLAANDIRTGNFKVPDLKKLDSTNNAPTAAEKAGVVDDGCPF